MTATKALLRSWLPPMMAAVVIFGGWGAILAVLRPDGFVLPPPSDIGSAVAENFDAIITATGVTGFIIVTGLLAGVVVGATFALLVTAFRAANETLTPLAVAVNAVRSSRWPRSSMPGSGSCRPAPTRPWWWCWCSSRSSSTRHGV